MKKTLILLIAACSLLACKKNGPVYNEEQQQNKFKETAEAVLDEVDVTAINSAMKDVATIVEEFGDKYSDGPVIDEIYDAIDAMISQKGSIEETVYNLHALCGKYSFVGGKQTKTAAKNLIEVNYENKYYATVTFSSETTTIIYYESKKSRECVQVPNTIDIKITKNGNAFITASANLSTNLTNVSSIEDVDFNNAMVSASMKVEAAGYTISVDKVSYLTRNAKVVTSVSNESTTIFSESIAVNKVEFTDSEPSGAGACSVEVDLLGQMQVKGSTSDLSALIDAYNNMHENRTNEKQFKKYLDKVNGLVDTGVYFSTDTKQSWLELYPFFYENNYSKSGGYWYDEPVFVLADGTRFEDPTEFFSETYFKSVIDRAERIANQIGNI